MLIFRQLFDPQSSTYTYLLGDVASHEAILIDPVFEHSHRDIAMLKELGLTLKYVLDTHCHADHVTAAWTLKQQTSAKIAISKQAGVEHADLYLSQTDQIQFGQQYVSVRETPGHTDGCISFVLHDQSIAFTGDCLLVRGCGRTDFQQGKASQLYQSVHEQLFSLPDSTLLYPGHDYKGLTVTSVAEEKKFNPRLGGEISATDFQGFMQNLNLPHPRQLNIALPANKKSGKPMQTIVKNTAGDWAKIHYTFAGIAEIEPETLEEITFPVQIVDVREAEEFHGVLGHIAEAKLIALGKLIDNIDKLDKNQPIVTVCRAGGRSAQANTLLKNAGFDKVVSLAGGMLRWCAEGHPVIAQNE